MATNTQTHRTIEKREGQEKTRRLKATGTLWDGESGTERDETTFKQRDKVMNTEKNKTSGIR